MTDSIEQKQMVVYFKHAAFQVDVEYFFKTVNISQFQENVA